VSGRTIRFVERASEAGSGPPATDVVVLDTWWTPGADDGPGPIPLRPVIERILAEADLVNGSLERLDAWAAEAGMADQFIDAGVTWWNKVRMSVRWDLHELMIWQRVLSELAPPGRYATIEIPWRRTALVAAANAAVAAERTAFGGGSDGPRVVTRHARRDLRDLYQRLRRFAGQSWRIRRAVGVVRGLEPVMRTRQARLEARIARLASDPPRVLGVAWAGAFHVVRDDGADRRMDPHIALVLERLAADGSPVAMVLEGLDHQHGGDWSTIAGDERIVPQSLVDERGWNAIGGRRSNDRRTQPTGVRPVPLVVDGVDLGPTMGAVVAGYAGRWLEAQVRATGWAERFLQDLRPGALYLDREGTRTKWIVAARRRGIPVISIQHGMIYPNNPEYCHPAHAAAVRPDVTCVFGEAERDLLIEGGGYPVDAVVVTGSPRADPGTIRRPATADERAAVRHELGVAGDDRLLVVSVAHNQVMGDLYGAAMVAGMLGGPLPGIHLVVKLHPQDRGVADYPRLLAGLAEAGRYPTPTVSTIRDMDLYRLLRSADAHLGQYSTVLTDAVVAGTPNMIAVADAYADPLGHVAAGVAAPVRSVDDVRRFMADPRPPADADREQFLRRHFEPGDAAGRIADLLLARQR
jgi:hypothetical protein